MPQTKHPITDVQLLLPGHLPQLAARSPDAHKGQFGHLLVIGGDRGFGGAALLSSESALRSGAGMVSLATRPEHVPAALARLPEVMAVGVSSANQLMGLLEKISVIVIGPGLGDDAWGKSLLSVAANASVPQVWDADALNQLATGSVELPANCVITPHPGEAARLLGLSTAEVQADRLKVARALSQKFNAVAILKGAGSLIASPMDGLPVVIKAIRRWRRRGSVMSWPAWSGHYWLRGCPRTKRAAWPCGCTRPPETARVVLVAAWLPAT